MDQLPNTSLVDSLLRASNEVVATTSTEKLPFLQSRNVSASGRRLKLLSSLLEELRDYSTSSPLPPSSLICLTEILSIVRQTKAVIERFYTSSALWSLLRTESVSREFSSCANEMGKALDILPSSLLLGLTPDVREQVDLLHRQAKRAVTYVDPREIRLREELKEMIIMSQLDCKKLLDDSDRLEEIMWRVGLRRASDYREEVSRLEAEMKEQAGTGGLLAVSNINSLIALVLSYAAKAKSTVFRSGGKSEMGFDRPSTTTFGIIPDEFRCPITLDLMRDPVIVASGHTYDRSSIARWINSGKNSCPKSGQKLIHMALIPNFAIRSLMSQWCNENNIPVPESSPTTTVAIDHISEVRIAAEAVRMTAEFLVGKLAMGSLETQQQAAYELRLLAKTGMDNRRMIAEAGAIPFLVTLLSSRDPRTQENAVTSLLNLSILDNNKILIMAAGAIDAIVGVVRSGAAMESRENAAATIYSLSMVDEYKVSIGARPGAIGALVGLLREGTAIGKKDATIALLSLAMYNNNANKVAIVETGAVPVLVGLLMDEKAGITDEVLSVMALLCGCGEGAKEIGASGAVVVPVLVDLMRFGSAKGKENSISVLLGLCRDRDGGDEMGRRLLVNPRSVPSLQSLAATGSPKARRKADAVLRLLNRCCCSRSRATASV